MRPAVSGFTDQWSKLCMSPLFFEPNYYTYYYIEKIHLWKYTREIHLPLNSQRLPRYDSSKSGRFSVFSAICNRKLVSNFAVFSIFWGTRWAIWCQKWSVASYPQYTFLDPPTLEVGPFVRQFVRSGFFSKTDHMISLIFCTELAYYDSKKVRELNFRKNCPNLGKMGPDFPKSGVLGHFLQFESLDFSDFAYYDR